jgi:ABC-type multidrug transport system ATPase subunit
MFHLGKTTLINMMLGNVHPTSGSIQTSGCKDGFSLGYCPQYDLFFEEFTIREHFWMAARIRGAKKEFIKDWIQNVAERVGLADPAIMKLKISQMSGGMKRRLSLGLAMMGHPSLLILDEPTTGVDPVNRESIWRLISDYQTANSDKPTSVLLTTHFIEEADALCDRVGIMKEGRLQCVAPQEELKQRYGHGFHLVVLVDFAMDAFGNENDVESQRKALEKERLSELNNEIMQVMSIKADTPLFEYNLCVRRREKWRGLSQGERVEWCLYARFVIQEEDFKGDRVRKLVETLEQGSAREWQLGLCDLQDVFVNVLL